MPENHTGIKLQNFNLHSDSDVFSETLANKIVFFGIYSMYSWIVHTTVLVNLFEAEPTIYKSFILIQS